MPPPAVRIYKDVCFISGSSCRKNSKSDDPNGHRFCDKKSVTQKVSKPMYSTASFLFSVRFVSDAALLRSLFCLVCRSSDLSIHAQRVSSRTNALLQPSLRAMTALPMTGFHRARITPYGKQCFRNTATLGSLPQIPARIARWPDSLPANPMG